MEDFRGCYRTCLIKLSNMKNSVLGIPGRIEYMWKKRVQVEDEHLKEAMRLFWSITGEEVTSEMLTEVPATRIAQIFNKWYNLYTDFSFVLNGSQGTPVSFKSKQNQIKYYQLTVGATIPGYSEVLPTLLVKHEGLPSNWYARLVKWVQDDYISNCDKERILVGLLGNLRRKQFKKFKNLPTSYLYKVVA